MTENTNFTKPCELSAARIRWLGTACFQVITGRRETILFDPFLDDAIGAPIVSTEIEACDYIFLTHGHWDHILDVGKLARRFRPAIFSNAATAAALVKHQAVETSLIHVVAWGDEVRKDGFSVRVLEGEHVDGRKEYERLSGKPYPDAEMRRDPEGTQKKVYRVTQGDIRLPKRHREWMQMYPAGEQLNFLLTLDNNLRIYVAGTYPANHIIAQAADVHTDITLLQVLSGGKLRGLEKKTAQLAMASGCSIVAPQHHDPIFEGATPTDLTALRQVLAKESTLIFKELIPGKWYALDRNEGRAGLIELETPQ